MQTAGCDLVDRGRIFHDRYLELFGDSDPLAPTELEDPTDLATLLKVDGREIALVEWSRYRALVAARRLEHFAATKTDFARPLAELQEELRRNRCRPG